MENRVEGTLRAFSHDMRTPLASVIALAKLSLDRLEGDGANEGETVAPYLRKILVAARDMEMMADDLLMDDAQTGREECFTARELAASMSAAVGERAAQKGQLLHIDVSALGERTLRGDRAALQRALMNLLSNAVKYTQAGGRVSLTARLARSTEEALEAEFIVEDNGMGMDASFMARMYEPLARSEQAQDKEIPGHGLGLTIVQRLTQRMNGTIKAESEPGRGTRFTLRLPLGLAKEAVRLEGKRFLLAEDNDLSAEIAQALLSGRGASVLRAADGRQAVQLFTSLPVGTFDAILMDMRMPQMGGCSAAAQIRSMQRADAECIPILALTAGGDEQDEQLAMAAGMNACLRKPLDMGRLCEAMGR